jgi:hypothetical protein
MRWKGNHDAWHRGLSSSIHPLGCEANREGLVDVRAWSWLVRCALGGIRIRHQDEIVGDDRLQVLA